MDSSGDLWLPPQGSGGGRRRNERERERERLAASLPKPVFFILNKGISNCCSLVTAWQDSREVSPEPGHCWKLLSSWFEFVPLFLLEKEGDTREHELMGHGKEEGFALSSEILAPFPFRRFD